MQVMDQRKHGIVNWTHIIVEAYIYIAFHLFIFRANALVLISVKKMTIATKQNKQNRKNPQLAVLLDV